MKAELKLIKTLWGIEEPISSDLFRSIKDEGYYGVEVIRLAWLFGKDVLVDSLNDAGLAVVCQVHTAGGYLSDDGDYVYCGAYDVENHKEDFQKQLQECSNLISLVNAGGFINVHAGVDAWSNDEALDFLHFCLNDIEQNDGNVTVTFETHRQRLFGSPFQTRSLLSSSSALLLSKLKINADLSHWYCACERVFNPEEDRDKIWWPKLISTLSEQCEYIHARFGWSQGPQMADPSASECETERKLQIDVWKILMREQIIRKKKKSNTGDLSIFVSPEYGPAPYLAVTPNNQEPVASLPNAVSYTKKIIEQKFQSII